MDRDTSGRGVPATTAMRAIPPASPAPLPPPRPDRGASGSSSGWIVALVGLGCLGLLGVGGIIVAGAAAGVVLGLRQGSSVPEPLYAEEGGGLGGPTVVGPEIFDPHSADRMQVPIAPGSPSRGAHDARVTIVELADFQCPFCARVSDTVGRVLAEHPDDVRLVWMDQPLAFHPSARIAARAGMEAQAQGGDARFWAMHDLLFANQSALDRAMVLTLGTQAGLDPARLASAIDGSGYDAAIDADAALAARFGATGTPSFFVNGRPLVGAQPYETFRQMIEDELAHARRFEAIGVPRAQLYEAITAHALTAAPAPARPVAAADPVDADRVFAVPLGTSPALGRADALVTIVAFSDFQCPFCARVVPTLDRLRETYGAELRIVFKHNPLAFHERAMPAAIASMVVMDDLGPAAFFRMHDVLFENQRALDDAALLTYAAQVGASEPQVRAALARGSHPAIVADQALALELGATGTPQFFVNGRSLRGAQPYESFATLVDAELARARAMVAAGTPRERVYDVIVAGAR